MVRAVEWVLWRTEEAYIISYSTEEVGGEDDKAVVFLRAGERLRVVMTKTA